MPMIIEARPVAAPARRTHQPTVLAVIAAVLAVFTVVVALHQGFFDLQVYQGAISFWAHGGHLYDFQLEPTTYGFTYPPFAALAMSPMVFLPWPVLVVVSTALSGAALTFVLYQLTRPLARRGGWDPWLTAGVAVVAAMAFEPVTDTLSFGQVNLVLLGLVTADLLLLSGKRRGAGALIGLAAAVKLTPAVFILYLLISGRRREALTAALTAAGATIGAALLAPQASDDFWTHALWQTDRVGSLSIAGNQSLRGLTARLAPHHAATVLWLIGVLAVLAVWALAVRRVSDVRLGLALTGVLSCLVSPITWVHHLVWLIPAMVRLVERALDTRRRWLVVAAIATYAVLDSRIVFLFDPRYTGWPTTGPGQLGASAFVLVSLFLGVGLAAAPARSAGSGRAAAACR